MDWQSQRTYIQSSLSKCTHRQEEKKPRKRDLILCCPWIHYCPLFSFLCAYISARWKHGSSGRDHVISAFFLHGCIIPSRCFSLRKKKKKKKEEEKESVRRGVRVVSSWTENRWLQPRCALVVIGEQNFLLIIRLVPSLSFTTNLKRIFRALIAKRQHSSSSDDGPGDALLFTSLFVFYDPRCFFPHYFVTRSTL